jgi:hypothetical protein
MALTLINAVEEIRDFVNEDTAAFFTDAEIQRWVQEGCRIFSAKSLLVEDTQDLDPLIASQLSYSSSDETWIGDCLEIYAAIHYNGTTGKYKGLRKEHPRQIGNSANFTAGVPKAYTQHNRRIYITPLTTAARVTAGDKITFLYAKETDDITAIQDEYQHLPIIYACAKCKQKDQKFAEASSLLSQFYQELSFERRDKHGREEDTIDMFKTKKSGGQQGAQ